MKVKRRKFGLMTGAGLAAVSAPAIRPADAQAAPDPNLLKTTLTPMGSERAGNADGSIPAWTGGVTAPPLSPDQPQDVPMFEDEKPLYTVDSSNMAQYAALLNEGTQEMISKFGFSLQVFKCHRTHALPQYVYDNNATNVANSKLDPRGGRFGFSGAFGGYPFPIIDTSDPNVAGAQLIWNHLLDWQFGYQELTRMTTGWVYTGSQPLLVYGGMERQYSPWYDPKMTLDKYDGYFTKVHGWTKAPASSDGQETLIWNSSNVLNKPNITWAVVAGQGRVRKAPDEAYDTPDPITDGIANYDDSSGFVGSPQKYDWKLIGKKEMIVPYNCNALALIDSKQVIQPKFVNPAVLRWEKHRVWQVEATLHPGERNTSARRMFYIDEDTYSIVLVDCYDANNTLVKTNQVHLRCLPHVPGTIENGFALYNLLTGNYTFVGYAKVPPYNTGEYIGPEAAEYFDPQQMAASASF